jgi:hypothetical protein
MVSDFMVNETMVKKECLCPMKCLKTTPTTLSAILKKLLMLLWQLMMVGNLKHTTHHLQISKLPNIKKNKILSLSKSINWTTIFIPS